MTGSLPGLFLKARQTHPRFVRQFSLKRLTVVDIWLAWAGKIWLQAEKRNEEEIAWPLFEKSKTSFKQIARAGFC